MRNQLSRLHVQFATVTVLISLICTLHASLACATVLEVPSEFVDIQSALNAAISGDIIVVEAGTYTGSIDFMAKDVTLSSISGPESTIIDGEGGKTVSIGPGGAIIGFSITGGTDRFGAGLTVEGDGTIIESNIFEDNHQTAGGRGAGIAGSNASPIVDSNLFRNCSCDSQFGAGVVKFGGSSAPIITNNVFVDNDCRALNLGLRSEGAPFVSNNTIVRNPVGIHVDARIPTVLQIYQNNIIVDNDIGLEVFFLEDGSEPTFLNNLVFNNSVNYMGIPDLTGTDGNITADPLFLDASMNDFHLLEDSPAIDSGVLMDAPLFDFEGDVRPLDGDMDEVADVDIGADEFVIVVVDDPTAPISGSDDCILAAAFGSSGSNWLRGVRKYRDNVMLSNGLGVAVADIYYRISPTVAPGIVENSVLATVVRACVVAGVLSLHSFPLLVWAGLLFLALAVSAVRKRFHHLVFLNPPAFTYLIEHRLLRICRLRSFFNLRVPENS